MAVLAYNGSDLDDFGLWADELEQWHAERATIPARIRLFDGDWVEIGEVIDRLDESSATRIFNQVGPITVAIPIDMEDRDGTWLAYWALDQEARGTSNIHVVVEKDGARIAGRTHPDNGVTLQHTPDGAKVVLSFLEDTQELAHVHVAANPFLPISLIQQPKMQLLFGPADWVLKASLAMNALRLQVFNFDMRKDILDPQNWVGGMWAQSQIVVMPGPISGSVSPTTIMTGTIKQSWLEIAQPILEDAELQIVTRRWLVGDPEPWPGAGTNWRNGTLFVDVVDKSGWLQGTSLGGNLATGLARTIASVTANYVEDSYDLLTGEPDTSGYRLPGFLGTRPEHPYAVYVDSELSPLPEFELVRGAGGPCRITAGGQSMPGVNELFEASIGYAGDVLGDNINIMGYGVGSLGNILNAFLMPILRNSVLAYMSVPLIGRAAEQGWGHYLETSCQGVTQAYTPAAIMDLRTRRRETDPKTSFSFLAGDGEPWLIGEQGLGDWSLGDRVGVTSRYLGARVFTRRCRELTLPLAGDPVWQPKFGDLRADMDPLEYAIGLISRTWGALNEIGLG